MKKEKYIPPILSSFLIAGEGLMVTTSPDEAQVEGGDGGDTGGGGGGFGGGDELIKGESSFSGSSFSSYNPWND